MLGAAAEEILLPHTPLEQGWVPLGQGVVSFSHCGNDRAQFPDADIANLHPGLPSLLQSTVQVEPLNEVASALPDHHQGLSGVMLVHSHAGDPRHLTLPAVRAVLPDGTLVDVVPLPGFIAVRIDLDTISGGNVDGWNYPWGAVSYGEKLCVQGKLGRVARKVIWKMAWMGQVKGLFVCVVGQVELLSVYLCYGSSWRAFCLFVLTCATFIPCKKYGSSHLENHSSEMTLCGWWDVKTGVMNTFRSCAQQTQSPEKKCCAYSNILHTPNDNSSTFSTLQLGTFHGNQHFSWCLVRSQPLLLPTGSWLVCLPSWVIIIMYIYHALINALSANIIHINLNMVLYTYIKTILPKQFT